MTQWSSDVKTSAEHSANGRFRDLQAQDRASNFYDIRDFKFTYPNPSALFFATTVLPRDHRHSSTSLWLSPSPSGVGQALIDVFPWCGTGTGTDGDMAGGGDAGRPAAAPAAPRYMLASASSLVSLVVTSPLSPSWDTTVERRRRPPSAEWAPAAARSLRRVMKEK